MKRLFILVLILILALNLTLPALAAEQSQPVFSEAIALDEDTVVINELFIKPPTARANYTTGVRRSTVTRSDVVIAILEFEVIYNYDGSTVYVVSKQITQTDTFDGWTFTKESFTQSGATVTLTGSLTKWLGRVDFSMTLTCDKDGNLSYT